jgi:diamine N-acetyltransferase
MSISLREVTQENWVQVIRLKLAPEQEGLVAPNVDSIAESKFEAYYVNQGNLQGRTGCWIFDVLS